MNATIATARGAFALGAALFSLAGGCRARPPQVVASTPHADPPVVDARVGDASTFDVTAPDVTASDVTVTDVPDGAVEATGETPTEPASEPDEPSPPRAARYHLAAVPLPTIDPAMRPAVRDARALVARTLRCWTSDGRLGTNRPSPECPALYAQLARGGDATLHALGTFLYDARDRRGASTRTPQVFYTADGLAASLEAHASLDAVAYVLAFLRETLEYDDCDWGKDRHVYRYMRVIAEVTGNDLRPIPPWQYEADERSGGLEAPQLMRLIADEYRAWARWYAAHRTQPLAAVRAEGATLARSRLATRDVALRVGAILRLGADGSPPEDREAARRSLVDLLAARIVSNAGRRYLRARAASHHLSLSAPDGGVAAP